MTTINDGLRGGWIEVMWTHERGGEEKRRRKDYKNLLAWHSDDLSLISSQCWVPWSVSGRHDDDVNVRTIIKLSILWCDVFGCVVVLCCWLTSEFYHTPSSSDVPKKQRQQIDCVFTKNVVKIRSCGHLRRCTRNSSKWLCLFVFFVALHPASSLWRS